jgi:protein kinase-like protein
MAAVYLARDVSLDRKVAIKTMLPELIGRQAMVQRFKREAQMAAGLSHPHIVPIHTVKQTSRIVYFVMKFIEGRDLDALIETHGPLDVDTTRMILQHAGSALAFAHHRGVIHRDVKPANIMIDENGWAVMTDFGIAKVDDGHNLTATGTAVGSPHYMAPEQFENQPLTAAADQYALGVVAYEMLTGRKPFEGNSLAEIIKQHLFNKPRDLRQERPDLPASVTDTVARMLAKQPVQRFPDVGTAIAALGPPDAAKLDDVRSRLMAFARSAPETRLRLSAPVSPVPHTTTRPSAPTTLVPDTGARRAAAARKSVSQAKVAPRAMRNAILLAVAALLVLAVPGYFGFRKVMADRASPESNAALQRGVQLWRRGMGEVAAAEFTTAARELPNSALPHIYLSRLARERGDLAVALDEAGRGARLEPNNALALREVGAVLLARNDYEGARRFLVRAIRANPQDQTAMGWLACSLNRLGDREQALRWSARAGAGAWSACVR